MIRDGQSREQESEPMEEYPNYFLRTPQIPT